MSNFTHIYNIQGDIKLLDTLNYTLEEFKSNPLGCYLTWNEQTMYATDTNFSYPKIDGDTIREKTQEELKVEGIIELVDGEYIQDRKLIIVEYDEKLGYLKRAWNKETHVWYEGATEEEITEHMGELVTKLLYEVMAIGCEVTIKGEKHQQSLSDDKRKALNERVSGFDLAQELGYPMKQVAWPFHDDGTDTIVISVEEFKQMTLYCLNYGEKCYLASELLKAKRKVNATIDDFYAELKNVDSISIENLA